MTRISQRTQDECWTACIASLMDRPIYTLPNFNTRTWLSDTRSWLKSQRYTLVRVKVPIRDVYHIASMHIKDLPKETYEHAVIWKNGKIVHDPGDNLFLTYDYYKRPSEFYIIVKG